MEHKLFYNYLLIGFVFLQISTAHAFGYKNKENILQSQSHIANMEQKEKSQVRSLNLPVEAANALSKTARCSLYDSDC